MWALWIGLGGSECHSVVVIRLARAMSHGRTEIEPARATEDHTLAFLPSATGSHTQATHESPSQGMRKSRPLSCRKVKDGATASVSGSAEKGRQNNIQHNKLAGGSKFIHLCLGIPVGDTFASLCEVTRTTALQNLLSTTR